MIFPLHEDHVPGLVMDVVFLEHLLPLFLGRLLTSECGGIVGCPPAELIQGRKYRRDGRAFGHIFPELETVALGRILVLPLFGFLLHFSIGPDDGFTLALPAKMRHLVTLATGFDADSGVDRIMTHAMPAPCIHLVWRRNIRRLLVFPAVLLGPCAGEVPSTSLL